jgi:hypothetical protein
LRCSLCLHPLAPRAFGDAKVKGKKAKRTPSLRRVERIGAVEYMSLITVHKNRFGFAQSKLGAIIRKRFYPVKNVCAFA